MVYSLCPICSSELKRWRTKLTDHGRFYISRCKKCRYAFVNPRPSINCIMTFYANISHKDDLKLDTMKTLESIIDKEKAAPNSTIDAVRMIRTISKLLRDSQNGNSTFLDMGCGYGFFSKEALNAGFDVTAIELSSTKNKISELLTGLKPIQVSFEEFDPVSDSYDVILFSQVLEHSFDEEDIEDERRVVLRLPPNIAPIQGVVLPLLSRDGLDEVGRRVERSLRKSGFMVDYDESGTIGRRYRRHDEIGTPFAITIDHQTLDDDTVTIRERDSMKQIRVPTVDLPNVMGKLIAGDTIFENAGKLI